MDQLDMETPELNEIEGHTLSFRELVGIVGGVDRINNSLGELREAMIINGVNDWEFGSLRGSHIDYVMGVFKRFEKGDNLSTSQQWAIAQAVEMGLTLQAEKVDKVDPKQLEILQKVDQFISANQEKALRDPDLPMPTVMKMNPVFEQMAARLRGNNIKETLERIRGFFHGWDRLPRSYQAMTATTIVMLLISACGPMAPPAEGTNNQQPTVVVVETGGGQTAMPEITVEPTEVTQSVSDVPYPTNAEGFKLEDSTSSESAMNNIAKEEPQATEWIKLVYMLRLWRDNHEPGVGFASVEGELQSWFDGGYEWLAAKNDKSWSIAVKVKGQNVAFAVQKKGDGLDLQGMPTDVGSIDGADGVDSIVLVPKDFGAETPRLVSDESGHIVLASDGQWFNAATGKLELIQLIKEGAVQVKDGRVYVVDANLQLIDVGMSAIEDGSFKPDQLIGTWPEQLKIARLEQFDQRDKEGTVIGKMVLGYDQQGRVMMRKQAETTLWEVAPYNISLENGVKSVFTQQSDNSWQKIGTVEAQNILHTKDNQGVSYLERIMEIFDTELTNPEQINQAYPLSSVVSYGVSEKDGTELYKQVLDSWVKSSVMRKYWLEEKFSGSDGSMLQTYLEQGGSSGNPYWVNLISSGGTAFSNVVSNGGWGTKINEWKPQALIDSGGFYFKSLPFVIISGDDLDNNIWADCLYKRLLEENYQQNSPFIYWGQSPNNSRLMGLLSHQGRGIFTLIDVAKNDFNEDYILGTPEGDKRNDDLKIISSYFRLYLNLLIQLYPGQRVTACISTQMSCVPLQVDIAKINEDDLLFQFK